MYRSHKIYLTIGLLLATCLAGCRDSLRSKRQRILDTFSHVSLASENERMSASRYCEEACTGIGMLGECERKEMLGILADRFLDIRFDEKSYGNRIVSIDAYVALVRMSFEALMKSVDDPESLWRFKQETLLRFNRELEKCAAEPKGGPYEHENAGNLVTQRAYAELLRGRRFHAIREEFETGPFTIYFNGLSDVAKSNWVARIESVADRKVVIYDPGDPFKPLPRYKPVDDREWVPSSDPRKPREYIEYLGGGRTIRMREVR